MSASKMAGVVLAALVAGLALAVGLGAWCIMLRPRLLAAKTAA